MKYFFVSYICSTDIGFEFRNSIHRVRNIVELFEDRSNGSILYFKEITEQDFEAMEECWRDKQ